MLIICSSKVGEKLAHISSASVSYATLSSNQKHITYHFSLHYSNKPAGQQHGNGNNNQKMIWTSSACHFTASLIWVILYAVLCSTCCYSNTTRWHTLSPGAGAQYLKNISCPGRTGSEVTSHKTTQRVEEHLEERWQTVCILRNINVQLFLGSWYFILCWIMFRDESFVLFPRPFSVALEKGRHTPKSS